MSITAKALAKRRPKANAKAKAEFFGPPEEAPRDPRFDPYRVPITDRGRALVDDIVRLIESREQHVGTRQRARKPTDHESFKAIATAIVSDVAHHHLRGSPGAGLIVTRAKRTLGIPSRYRAPVLTNKFPDVLDAMAALGLLKQTIGGQSTPSGPLKSTTVKAGAALVRRIADRGLTLADFGLSGDGEVIILKSLKRGYGSEPQEQQYEDTALTLAFRQEVLAVNAWLREANVTFDHAAALKALPADAKPATRAGCLWWT